MDPTPASSPGRRRRRVRRPSAATVATTRLAVVLLVAGLLLTASAHAQRRWVIAFANATEAPGVTLEGTGFTGREVRESFNLAVRLHPIELVFYDNAEDDARAVANAEAAVARKVDLYVQYHRGAAANATVGQKLKAAGIPVLAVSYPVPGAPLYSVDNAAAGRVAGEALAEFATRSWPGQPTVAVIIGRVSASADRVPERVRGIGDVLRQRLPSARLTTLDTQGNPAQVGPLLGAFLAAQASRKVLIAATDAATALAAKSAVESAGRLRDAAIVSHGVDRSIHGGANDRKEIDPSNRGSIVIGSVAFYLDRLGYEVLPLTLRMLRGESVPAITATPHKLITAANVFIEYPPYDMN
jgi:ABC-type sugar transport system substrate-binding protein